MVPLTQQEEEFQEQIPNQDDKREDLEKSEIPATQGKHGKKHKRKRKKGK